MNKKGQGALEYLLLIGGAILVAVVVITILSQVGGSSGKQTEYNAISGICASKATQANCTAAEVLVGSTSCDCIWTTSCAVETPQASCVAGD
ncbi:MAG: class III signal peptide-containing protein [Candidatus Diapherotrites archaeon]|nr:class III signal peptide-containing protein [Candidatus Diapherotrites archaeon]